MPPHSISEPSHSIDPPQSMSILGIPRTNHSQPNHDAHESNLITAHISADHGDATYVCHSIRVISSDPISVPRRVPAFIAYSYASHSRHGDRSHLQTARTNDNRCRIASDTTPITMRCRHCAPENDMRHSIPTKGWLCDRSSLHVEV